MIYRPKYSNTMGYSWGWEYGHIAERLSVNEHWLQPKVDDSYVMGFRILTV